MINSKPNGVCADCIKEAGKLENQTAIYCEHHQAGAFLRPLQDGNELWIIHQPLDAQSFSDLLLQTAEFLKAQKLLAEKARKTGSVSIN